jgi:hypothetical protein
VTTGQLKVTRRGRCRRGGGAAAGAGETPVVGGVVAAGGRPRFGGCSTGTSGGDLHGLSLSVENVSTRPPTCSLKKRRDLSRTRYGPSQAGHGRLFIPRRVW